MAASRSGSPRSFVREPPRLQVRGHWVTPWAELEDSKAFYFMMLERKGVGVGGDALPYLKTFSFPYVFSRPCSLRWWDGTRNTS